MAGDVLVRDELLTFPRVAGAGSIMAAKAMARIRRKVMIYPLPILSRIFIY